MLNRFFRSVHRQLIRVGLGRVTFANFARFYQGRLAQFVVRLFGPSAVFVSLAFCVAIDEAKGTRASEAEDAIAERTSSTSVIDRVLAAGLYARTGLVDFFRCLFFRFRVTRDAPMFVANDERLIVVIDED